MNPLWTKASLTLPLMIGVVSMLFSEVHLQITNCTQMNPGLDLVNKPSCKTCAFGYLLAQSGYGCLACRKPCAACFGHTNLCLSCLPGYIYDASRFRCRFCGTGVATCDANRTPLTCLPRHLLVHSPSKVCLSCPENCLECNSTRNCNKCAPNFIKRTNRGYDRCVVPDEVSLKQLHFFSTFGVAVLLFILLCTSSVCHYQRRKELEIKEVEQINEAVLMNLLKITQAADPHAGIPGPQTAPGNSYKASA